MSAAGGPADRAAALPGDPTTPVARMQSPAPVGVALTSVSRCAGTAAGMLLRGRLQMPSTWVGTRVHFADGTAARVYRETRAVRPPSGPRPPIPAC